MKKTQFTELIQNIKKTWVSFVSIVFCVMLGTCIFLGVDWSITGFSDTVEQTLKNGKMYDCDILYPYGFTEQAVYLISNVTDVSAVEGYYTSEQFFRNNGLLYQARVTMLTKKINTPTAVVGTLPEKTGQIAVERHWAEQNGVGIGDTITFQHDDDGKPYLLNALCNGDTEYLQHPTGSADGMQKLTADTFYVTALVEVPQYINQFRATYGVSSDTGTPNDCLLFVSEDAFDARAFAGYPQLLVVSNELRKLGSVTDEYARANQELEDNIRQVADAFAAEKNEALQQAIRQIQAEQGKEVLDIEIQNYTCTILGRNENPGLGITTVPTDTLADVRYTMTLLFVLVGVLVCFSTMSRIVYEQSVLIGTKKALGFRRKEITVFYLRYAFYAVVVGWVSGVVSARFVAEIFIVRSLAKSFNLVQPTYYCSWPAALLFFLFETASLLLCAFLACRKVLKKTAVALLTDDGIRQGKIRFFEKSIWWNKLSLLGKTIINNCLNDKRRTVATLIGLVGCCSIVVSAVTMYASLRSTYDYQMSRIMKYDTVIFFDSTVEQAEEKIGKVLSEKQISYTPVYYSSMYLQTSSGSYTSSTLFAFDDDSFYDYLTTARDGEPCRVKNGLWVCKAFGRYNRLCEGDEVTLVDGKGVQRTMPISGVFDHYLLRSFLVTDAAHYEELFGEPYRENAILLDREDAGTEELFRALDGTDGFISVFDAQKEAWESYGALINAVAVIAVTFAVQAVLLSFLVILNLLVMFVTEKKRELIVLMINGYSRARAKKLIYSDTILLTVIGVVLGCVLGCAVAFLTLGTFESESVIIIKQINFAVCGICAGFTGLLVLINSLIALHRINEYKLADINDM